MIENLQRHYKDAFITADIPRQMDTYTWFFSNKDGYFGIMKHRLSPEEEKLLSSLFIPFSKQQTEMSDSEALWYNYLFLKKDFPHSIEQPFSHCRFIQFQASRPVMDKQEFQLGAKALFPFEIILLWENDQQGVLIETFQSENHEAVSYEEIVDTFTSDFFIDIHLFIGQTYSITRTLSSDFWWEKSCFQTCLHSFHHQKVYRVHDVLPLLILENIDSEKKEKLKGVILQELQTDKELLETIKVFFESNLNVSNAAKRLYMHRNSLQYRIDKFIEKTGIDIKHFKGAVTTYLAILCIEHFQDS